MFDSTVYEVLDGRNVFLSPVYIATVLICATVNWVFCFANILIVAFVAFDQVYDVTGLACFVSCKYSASPLLAIKYRIEFKILLMTFKAIHGMAPDYICKLISRRKSTGYIFAQIQQKSYA